MFTNVRRFVRPGSLFAFAGAIAITTMVLVGAKPIGGTPDLSEVRLGTYQPQEAFNMYSAAEEMQQRSQELQQEMQQAQQQGDQQRMMQIQQQFQQLQMQQEQIIQRFFADVERAMPRVAEEQGLHIVAVDIVYAADEIGEPRDLTRELMDIVNETAETPREQPPAPEELPW